MAGQLGAQLIGARSLDRVGLPAMPAFASIRRKLTVALALLLLAAAVYMLWFRDSSFVAIERVEVTGAESAPDVVTALTSAAGEMSTLHVDINGLRAAVADNPAVLDMSTDVDFPHGLTIAVDLRVPAGYVEAGDGAIVAADGVVLETGVSDADGLPAIEVDSATLGEGRIEGPALIAARVLGAAPEPLRPQIESAAIESAGSPVVTLVGGIELRFGTPSQADLKWRAAATVLADPDVDVASYIDLSVPSRPVLG